MIKLTEVLIGGAILIGVGVTAQFVGKGVSNIQEAKRRKVVL